MLKIKKLIIAGLLGIFPIIGFAETKQVKTPGQLCAKASGLSNGFAEYVATHMGVPVRSVSLIRALSNGPYGDCSVKVDTAKGPQSCAGAILFTDGKGEYWIGGNCYF